jgi:hypothetical protein
VVLSQPGQHLGHQGEQHRLEGGDPQRAAHLGQRGAQFRLGLLEPREDHLGILLSLEPAVATLAGWLLLGQRVAAVAVPAIAVVMLASVGATVTARAPAAD